MDHLASCNTTKLLFLLVRFVLNDEEFTLLRASPIIFVNKREKSIHGWRPFWIFDIFLQFLTIV